MFEGEEFAPRLEGGYCASSRDKAPLFISEVGEESLAV
jgi:hypothetical protein